MSTFRVIEPSEGRPAWIRGGFGWSIPEGLEDHQQVAVSKLTGGIHNRQAIVESHGKDILVRVGLLDAGREWQTERGRWIPESDSRVRRWLLKALDELKNRPYEPGGKLNHSGKDQLERMIRDFEWVMRRNGWEVE